VTSRESRTRDARCEGLWRLVAVAGRLLLDVLIEGASTPWMGAVTPGGPSLLGQETLARWLMGGMDLTGVVPLPVQACGEGRDDRPPHATAEEEP
jgi:hypothetical protein